MKNYNNYVPYKNEAGYISREDISKESIEKIKARNIRLGRKLLTLGNL